MREMGAAATMLTEVVQLLHVPREACKRCHSSKKLLHAAQNEDV